MGGERTGGVMDQHPRWLGRGKGVEPTRHRLLSSLASKRHRTKLARAGCDRVIPALLAVRDNDLDNVDRVMVQKQSEGMSEKGSATDELELLRGPAGTRSLSGGDDQSRGRSGVGHDCFESPGAVSKP